MTVPLYEHPAWQAAPLGILRPGGLEITARALMHCNLPAGACVLDVGCGMGAALHHLRSGRDWRCFGVDLSARLLGQARRNCPAAGFAQSPGEWLPIASASLDAIIAECTLSIMDSARILSECARTLKPGGYLVVNDVYARRESGIPALRSLPPGTCIGAAMSEVQIRAALGQHGLHVTVWQDCSEALKEFPFCTLSSAAEVDPFDLVIAAGKAKLGYYWLVAQTALP